MSRFNGAAGKGASRTLRAVRRAEAETRQAAYDALGARATPRPGRPGDLTRAQMNQLRDAMLRADALEAYRQTWTRGAR